MHMPTLTAVVARLAIALDVPQFEVNDAILEQRHIIRARLMTTLNAAQYERDNHGHRS
jgi:hypothetical protein